MNTELITMKGAWNVIYSQNICITKSFVLLLRTSYVPVQETTIAT